MEISDVRVKLINDGNDRLKAVCTVTFDEQFVVRDVKVVDGTSGLFVAMPSRKVSVHCPKCSYKNAVRSRFCNDCGGKLPPSQPTEEENGRSRLHRDIAHPITTPFRELLQAGVLKAYESEVASPSQPSRNQEPRQRHVPQDDNDDDNDSDTPVNTYDADRDRDADDPAGGDETISEYDAIIAGLRSGSGRGSSRRDAAPNRNRDQADSRPRREERNPSRELPHGRGAVAAADS